MMSHELIFLELGFWLNMHIEFVLHTIRMLQWCSTQDHSLHRVVLSTTVNTNCTQQCHWQQSNHQMDHLRLLAS